MTVGYVPLCGSFILIAPLFRTERLALESGVCRGARTSRTVGSGWVRRQRVVRAGGAAGGAMGGQEGELREHSGGHGGLMGTRCMGGRARDRWGVLWSGEAISRFTRRCRHMRYPRNGGMTGESQRRWNRWGVVPHAMVEWQA